MYNKENFTRPNLPFDKSLIFNVMGKIEEKIIVSILYPHYNLIIPH